MSPALFLPQYWPAWLALYAATFLATLGAALVGLGLLTRHRASLTTQLPLGPFLYTGTLFAVLLLLGVVYALVFMASADKKTVPVGVVSELIRGDVFFWGQLMAGALLGSVPVALVYSFFVEYYVAGLTGSVKG